MVAAPLALVEEETATSDFPNAITRVRALVHVGLLWNKMIKHGVVDDLIIVNDFMRPLIASMRTLSNAGTWEAIFPLLRALMPRNKPLGIGWLS